MTLERRAAPLEIRAAGRRLVGLAAPIGVEVRIGTVTESISAGAFAATLADGHDVLALADHLPDKLLGRTRSGSLRLSADERGLRFELDLPATTLGNDVLALAERGDLGGVSIGFRAKDEQWNGQRRELRAIDLAEVSIISGFSAYPTEIAVRSRPPCDDSGRRFRLAMTRWRP